MQAILYATFAVLIAAFFLTRQSLKYRDNRRRHIRYLLKELEIYQQLFASKIGPKELDTTGALTAVRMLLHARVAIAERDEILQGLDIRPPIYRQMDHIESPKDRDLDQNIRRGGRLLKEAQAEMLESKRKMEEQEERRASA